MSPSTSLSILWFGWPKTPPGLVTDATVSAADVVVVVVVVVDAVVEVVVVVTSLRSGLYRRSSPSATPSTREDSRTARKVKRNVVLLSHHMGAKLRAGRLMLP